VSVGAQQLIALGDLGGGSSVATAINDTGVVAGSSTVASGHSHAFSYAYGLNGVMTDLQTLGGTDSYAFGISSAGTIVGFSLDGSGQTRSFSTASGSMTSLDSTLSQFVVSPPYSSSNPGFVNFEAFPSSSSSPAGSIAISSGGTIAGSGGYFSSLFSFPYSQGFIDSGGSSLEEFDGLFPASPAIQVQCIDSFVAGASSTPTLDTHAFYYFGGNTTDMGTLGGKYSNAFGTAGSNIVGESSTSPTSSAGGAIHAFLYNTGSMTDLGTLAGDTGTSSAYGVNWPAGQVVGTSSTSASGDHAFVYTAATGMQDLNTLYAPLLVNPFAPNGAGTKGFISLAAAYAINSYGEIVGQGTYYNGGGATNQSSYQQEAFLIIPGAVAPNFTSASTTTFTVGVLSNFTVAAAGFPAPTFTSVNLPTWASLNPTTGVLSGTPPSTSGAPYSIVITAGNGILPNATQLFTLNVQATAPPAAPTFTSAASKTFTIGTSNTFSVSTAGYPTPTITETNSLPTGISFVDNGNGTATLSGVPPVGTSGPYSLTLAADNGVGTSATQKFTLTVGQTPGITSANSETFAAGSSNTFTVYTNGYPTATITETGSLPTGITFTDNGNGTATLTGTPAASASSSYNITVLASNGVGLTTQTLVLTVSATAAVNPNIFVGDWAAHTIQQFNPSGVGSAFVATSNIPEAMAMDFAGNLYVAVTNSIDDGIIEKFAPDGTGTLFASGLVDPRAMTVDRQGNVYVTSEGTEILKYSPGGVMSVFASGVANPLSLAVDSQGNVYAIAASSLTIQKFTPAGVASTFYSPSDGGALFQNPYGLAVDSSDNVYATAQLQQIDKFTPTGTMSVFATFTGPGTANPTSIIIDATGNVYLENSAAGIQATIEKYTPSGASTFFANIGSINFTDYLFPLAIQPVIITLPVTITTQPINQSVSPESNASFRATASGAPAPTVQWQLSTNGGATYQNISGATNATYTFTATTSESGGLYQAVFTNSSGSVTTNPASLTVTQAIAITSQPSNQTVNAGTSASFTAAASGFPTPTVQWQVSTDGGVTYQNVMGATSATYGFTATTTQSGDLYHAVFTDTGGSLTSNAATLTVTQAVSITTQPSDQAATAGATATFTSAASGFPTPTVQWQVSTDGGATYQTVTSATSDSYSFTAATVLSGNLYRAVFTNVVGSVTSNAVTLTVAIAPPTLDFSDWASQYFNSNELANSSVSGLEATPEIDGVPNLLKYLFDIDPSVPMTTDDRAALPTVGLDTTSQPGTEFLSLTYREYGLVTGVTVNVQTSADLQPGTWTTPVNSSITEIGTTADGDLIMRAEVPITTSKQFIRLNVTQP